MKYFGKDADKELDLLAANASVWQFVNGADEVKLIDDEDRVKVWKVSKKKRHGIVKFSVEERVEQALEQIASEHRAAMMLSDKSRRSALLVLTVQTFLVPGLGVFSISPYAGVSVAKMRKSVWGNCSDSELERLSQKLANSLLLTQLEYQRQAKKMKDQPFLLHKDIKPENVCYVEDDLQDDRDFFRSIDYGGLSSLDHQLWVNVRDIRYIDCQMAQYHPEVRCYAAQHTEGLKRTTYASTDIYLTALTVVEVYLGHLPKKIDFNLYGGDENAYLKAVWNFRWETCPELLSMPAPMRSWLLKALAFDPSKRFQSAHEAMMHPWLRSQRTPVIFAVGEASADWDETVQSISDDLRGDRSGRGSSCTSGSSIVCCSSSGSDSDSDSDDCSDDGSCGDGDQDDMVAVAAAAAVTQHDLDALVAANKKLLADMAAAVDAPGSYDGSNTCGDISSSYDDTSDSDEFDLDDDDSDGSCSETDMSDDADDSCWDNRGSSAAAVGGLCGSGFVPTRRTCSYGDDHDDQHDGDLQGGEAASGNRHAGTAAAGGDRHMLQVIDDDLIFATSSRCSSAFQLTSISSSGEPGSAVAGMKQDAYGKLAAAAAAAGGHGRHLISIYHPTSTSSSSSSSRYDAMVPISNSNIKQCGCPAPAPPPPAPPLPVAANIRFGLQQTKFAHHIKQDIASIRLQLRPTAKLSISEYNQSASTAALLMPAAVVMQHVHCQVAPAVAKQTDDMVNRSSSSRMLDNSSSSNKPPVRHAGGRKLQGPLRVAAGVLVTVLAGWKLSSHRWHH